MLSAELVDSAASTSPSAHMLLSNASWREKRGAKRFNKIWTDSGA